MVAEAARDVQVDRRQARPESQVAMLFQTRTTDIWATQCVFRGDNTNSRFLEVGPNRRLYLRGEPRILPSPPPPPSRILGSPDPLPVFPALLRFIAAPLLVLPSASPSAGTRQPTPIQHGWQAERVEHSVSDGRSFRAGGW